MNQRNNVSLEDTLYMIQLARETALASGRESDAARLEPVVEGMRELVAATRQEPLQAPESAGISSQQDFQSLLVASQERSAGGEEAVPGPAERSRMVQAMSAAQMSEVEIAWQLGMTRDEVRLVISMQNQLNRSRSTTGKAGQAL